MVQFENSIIWSFGRAGCPTQGNFKKEKSPAKCRGQEIPVVPPQFVPFRGPHGIQINPQAVSGPTRLCLLVIIMSLRTSPQAGVAISPIIRFSKAAPKGIPFPGPHCLAPTGSSLAEPLEMYWFSSTRYRYVLPSLPLCRIEVNEEKVRKYTNPSSVFCAFCQRQGNRCFSQENSRHLLQVSGGVL